MLAIFLSRGPKFYDTLTCITNIMSVKLSLFNLNFGIYLPVHKHLYLYEVTITPQMHNVFFLLNNTNFIILNLQINASPIIERHS